MTGKIYLNSLRKLCIMTMEKIENDSKYQKKNLKVAF